MDILGTCFAGKMNNLVEFLFWETKQMVVQFTEMHRNGLTWLRGTVKQNFYFGHGTLGTHKWKCQVSYVSWNSEQSGPAPCPHAHYALHF